MPDPWGDVAPDITAAVVCGQFAFFLPTPHSSSHVSRSVWLGRKMCKDCMIEMRPDRGTICLESGAYIANLKSCAACGARQMPLVAALENTEEEEDDALEEEVNFDHVCASCGHVIAHHYYRYHADDAAQTHLMECFLCGRGADERPSPQRARAIAAARALEGGGDEHGARCAPGPKVASGLLATDDDNGAAPLLPPPPPLTDGVADEIIAPRRPFFEAMAVGATTSTPAFAAAAALGKHREGAETTSDGEWEDDD